MIYISEQQVELFKSLFRGRSDIYARHWEKNGKSGYSPAYEFEWVEFMAHKRRGGSMKDFENKKLMPLTDEVIRQHLLGQHTVGLYPILPDNTSYFIAADFDGANWIDDSREFLQACENVGILAYLERSRSGNGGHVWIFFAESYPCHKSRQIALELIRKALHTSEFEKEVSFDRLFPNQDVLTGAGSAILSRCHCGGVLRKMAILCLLIRRIRSRSPISGNFLLPQKDIRRESWMKYMDFFFRMRENRKKACRLATRLELSSATRLI